MIKTEAANQIVLMRPDLLRVTVAGNQNGESVANTLQQVKDLLGRSDVDPRASLLIDLTSNPGQNLAARREARNFLTFLRHHRIALFGGGYLLKTVVDIIIKGSGMTGHVGNFYTQKEALDWLGRSPQGPPTSKQM